MSCRLPDLGPLHGAHGLTRNRESPTDVSFRAVVPFARTKFHSTTNV